MQNTTRWTAIGLCCLLLALCPIANLSARADAGVDGGTDDSVIYYLYVAACESCARARRVLDALPDTVEIVRGAETIQSAVVVRSVDIGQSIGEAQALFDHYGVPAAKRLAPIVFLGDRYLQGADSIENELVTAIQNGEALSTPSITGEADFSAISVVATLGAGLVGGLNPCALSMLLLFLSLLVGAGQRTGRLTALFLVSKFVTYLLIGTVLLSVLQRWNPTWLPLAIKLLLTAFSIVFIILNVSDAIAAMRGDYGKIRNQPPAGLRRGLQTRIQSALQNPKGAAGWVVAGLGVVVAASEFLCAGQVYLATLLASIQQGSSWLQGFMQLVLYCAAFLVPSIALSLLVSKGATTLAVSAALSRRMPLVKLITALFFVIVLLLVWLM